MSRGRAGDRCYPWARARLMPPLSPALSDPDRLQPAAVSRAPSMSLDHPAGFFPHTAGNSGSEWAIHLSRVTQLPDSRGGLPGRGRRGRRGRGVGQCRAAEQETTGQELCASAGPAGVGGKDSGRSAEGRGALAAGGGFGVPGKERAGQGAFQAGCLVCRWGCRLRRVGPG